MTVVAGDVAFNGFGSAIGQWTTLALGGSRIYRSIFTSRQRVDVLGISIMWLASLGAAVPVISIGTHLFVWRCSVGQDTPPNTGVVYGAGGVSPLPAGFELLFSQRISGIHNPARAQMPTGMSGEPTWRFLPGEISASSAQKIFVVAFQPVCTDQSGTDIYAGGSAQMSLAVTGIDYSADVSGNIAGMENQRSYPRFSVPL